jgi:hypothetical protein
MNAIKTALKVVTTITLMPAVIYADSNTTDDVQDMSDPLAVYTQAGFGITNKGINIKVGQAYDTGNPETMGMNIIEIKGIAGETLGWEDDGVASDSVDSLRFRNFSVNLTNGRGTQIDVSYNLHSESGSATYSMLQALPKFGNLSLYPLAGIGIAFANNALQDDGTIASGYSVPGTLAVVGMYAKYAINDQIWINYNPVWSTGLSGSDLFMDHGFGGEDSILAHEFALSYQINPRMNVRYFANWSEYVDFGDGDHRLELNYQF